MELLIKKISIFAGTVLVAALLLDLAVTAGLKRTGHGDWGIWNAVYSGKLGADVVLSGNSRTAEHIDPDIIDRELGTRSCNLGMAGFEFETQYHAYMIYELYNRKPRLIIQNIDAWEFMPGQDGTNKMQFFAYILDPRLRAYLLRAGFKKKYLYLPFLRYLGNPRHITGGLVEFFRLRHFPTERLRGYGPVNGGWDGTDLANFRRRYNNVLVPGQDPHALGLLEDLLKHCRDNKIQLVMVHSPLYHEATEIIKDREGFMAIFSDLGRKYGAPVLDYTNDKLSGDTAYFYGAMHLNKEGSRLFSAKLAKDIKKLRILK
ncbi:MAG TPA: hypothetical protein DCS63_08970 [Elusimicrobia bacterium]|nr:hypothetical protein [Elusimicrobiota bacterium]